MCSHRDCPWLVYCNWWNYSVNICYFLLSITAICHYIHLLYFCFSVVCFIYLKAGSHAASFREPRHYWRRIALKTIKTYNHEIRAIKMSISPSSIYWPTRDNSASTIVVGNSFTVRCFLILPKRRKMYLYGLYRAFYYLNGKKISK